MTDERGILVPELRDVFFLIKEYGAVLATGHISPEETRCVVDAARNIGVQKIVVTHPEYWVVDMSLEQQYELVSDYGVLERCFRQPQKSGAWVSNAARNLAAIRQLGTANTILSTGCGDPAVPSWENAMREYLQYMADHGVDSEALADMTRRLPAWLLGLEDAP